MPWQIDDMYVAMCISPFIGARFAMVSLCELQRRQVLFNALLLVEESHVCAACQTAAARIYMWIDPRFPHHFTGSSQAPAAGGVRNIR